MDRIEQEYAYATEINLATLEELVSLKSSSKSRVERQRGICLRMLHVCKAVEAHLDFRAHGCRSPRVGKLLEAAKSIPEGIEGALDTFIHDNQVKA
jgi:hypothetical protein